jgi:ubiquinone/menaquinone biosynthesis C-methylase UbiE
MKTQNYQVTKSLNLAKTILHTWEYKSLLGLSQIFSLWVKAPHQESRKEIMDHLKKEVLSLHALDAHNTAQNIYGPSEITINDIADHIKYLPLVLLDSLRVSYRRKNNIHNDLPALKIKNKPDYIKRNFHFQTGGYFSKYSARLYEQQVEILFSGTAAAMRRLLIEDIKKVLKTKKKIKILELAAGTGAATKDFMKSFDYSHYVVSDISSEYLSIAQKKINDSHIEFVTTCAESLPFKDNSFDLVFSIYLFHEIPSKVREMVLAESFRVLKQGGVIGICDSLQKNDVPILNPILAQFPLDYHEPFYKNYTVWNAQSALTKAGFKDTHSRFKLLSKYFTAIKK